MNDPAGPAFSAGMATPELRCHPAAPPDLRVLPSVDAVLQHESIRKLCDTAGRVRVTGWVRQVVEILREDLGESSRMANRDELIDDAVRLVGQRAADASRQRLNRVINATGVILHTNLGRAPLAEAALDAVYLASRYTNLELDLDTGRRGARGGAIERLWRELTGAEAALVVNNCAAATFLTLQTVTIAATRTLEASGSPGGREVLISRGQLIEIGGSYRLPDVFAASGAILREVGTTNRTRLADYAAAITDATAAILRAHHSNYRIVGFTEDVPIAPLAELAHERGLIAIDDVGSGCLYDLSPYGLSGEPMVGESLRVGADLVLFSGDKLLGGPQCGVILGKRQWIERLGANPLARALRVDKLTLAALQATLEIHLAGNAFNDIPVLRMLAEPADQVRARADRLLSTVGSAAAALRPDVASTQATIGGGSLPGQTLASWALRLHTTAPDRLAHALRAGTPAVLPRLDDGAVLLDLRTVLPDEEQLLTHRLQTLSSDFRSPTCAP
jgi:L-seryl-tRNA(Ser) seleniumtransferase